MAAFHPMTFLIAFDADGALVDFRARPTPDGRPDEEGLRAWQESLGFSPSTVRVRRFSIPGHGLGIEDLTGFDEDLLEDPESEPDQQERAEQLPSIREWVESGSFVLRWGNELWLDARGEVTSS
jgi:hypothetical protein